MPMPLTSADLHKLESESWIDAATTQAFGLYRVASHEGAELVGRSNKEDYTGIVYPVYSPGDLKPCEYFLRRDHPPLNENGKPLGKYLGPPDRGNKLLFGPHESPESLTNIHQPILFVEGLKKLLAAWRLARYNTELRRFLVCAIAGVYGWRGTIGKTIDPTGKRVDKKGPILDLKTIAWPGRNVVVIFDSDVATNEKVAKARNGLVHVLQDHRAKVSVVDFPELDGLHG